mmetsp:Transcript_8295/g.20976  ORF Transcript_8295/g.20976 Transcript_8295/m.20976 type:complete len:224 (-) Transcript_8295:1947-2618(-)
MTCSSLPCRASQGRASLLRLHNLWRWKGALSKASRTSTGGKECDGAAREASEPSPCAPPVTMAVSRLAAMAAISAPGKAPAMPLAKRNNPTLSALSAAANMEVDNEPAPGEPAPASAPLLHESIAPPRCKAQRQKPKRWFFGGPVAQRSVHCHRRRCTRASWYAAELSAAPSPEPAALASTAPPLDEQEACPPESSSKSRFQHEDAWPQRANVGTSPQKNRVE